MPETPHTGSRRSFIYSLGVLTLASTILGTGAAAGRTQGELILDQDGQVYDMTEDLTIPVRITGDDVLLDGRDDYGINVDDGPAVTVTGDNATIRDTFFYNQGGILYKGSHGGRVVRCQFRNSQGIELDDCFKTEIWNNYFKDCREPVMLVDSDECLVKENRTYNPVRKGINLIRGYGNVVTDNDVDRSQTRDGIYAVDSRRATFSGNWSNDNARAGLRLTRSDGAVVTGNRFTGNEGQTAVVVNASDDVLVMGNYDIDGGEIVVEGGSDDVTIFGNDPD